jgi:hypothetical protein
MCNHVLQIAAEAAQRQLLEAEMTRVLQGSTVLSTALGRHDPDFSTVFLFINHVASRCPPPRGEAVALTTEFFYQILSPPVVGAAGRHHSKPTIPIKRHPPTS